MTHEIASSPPVYLSTNSLNYHVTPVSFRVSQALGLGVAMGDRWLRLFVAAATVGRLDDSIQIVQVCVAEASLRLRDVSCCGRSQGVPA